MARPIEKRDSIERGVVEVVAQKGLSATTIQDIADAASVSPGLLYRYWRSRNDLAGEVYRAHYEQMMKSLFARVGGGQTPWGQIDAVLREFLRFAEEKPVIIRFLLLTQHDLVANIPAELGIRRILSGIFEQGMQAGVIRRMPPALAIHLALGLVLQPVIGVIYGHLPPPMTQYGDEILHALRRTLEPDGMAEATSLTERARQRGDGQIAKSRKRAEAVDGN